MISTKEEWIAEAMRRIEACAAEIDEVQFMVSTDYSRNSHRLFIARSEIEFLKQGISLLKT